MYIRLTIDDKYFIKNIFQIISDYIDTFVELKIYVLLNKIVTHTYY